MLSHILVVSYFSLFLYSIHHHTALFVVYNFEPCVETLESWLQGSEHPCPFSERLLWRMSTQLISALKSVHESSLSCGNALHPSKILIGNLCEDHFRFYINCCGLADVVNGDSSSPAPPTTPTGTAFLSLSALPALTTSGSSSSSATTPATVSPLSTSLPSHSSDELDGNDLRSLGRLILAAALHDLSAFQEENQDKALEQIEGQFSAYFISFVKYLLGLGDSKPSVNEAIAILAPVFASELSSAYTLIDTVTGELEKELQNGRLFRLLAKLNFVVQRPETFRDSSWQAHGGSYLLSIFCDYVFMSDSEDPTDLAHVVNCLNKLDAGSPEKLMLISRDNQDCYVVSYLELKNLLDKTFLQMK